MRKFHIIAQFVSLKKVKKRHMFILIIYKIKHIKTSLFY